VSPLDHAEALAKKLLGNHRRFEAFGWHDRPEDDEQWCIVYTTNRDADALTRSNARQYAKALDPFCTGEDDADCREEHHGHWACGWVDGYAIRVRREGKLTPAFLAYAELKCAEDSYPVLCEEDFSIEEDEEAQETWKRCYSDKERLAYIRKNWRDFEVCQAKWYPAADAWRKLLACVRGEAFFGSVSAMVRS
jgi:hypothetical protein